MTEVHILKVDTTFQANKAYIPRRHFAIVTSTTKLVLQGA
ncbi:15118_t:CDS:2 [Dentiscutata heterogama]|uniref:15118_t:CDS:1 n=1 Tax=Dentiscutata heterogama TaxID=1316150 RepID=A0ACA9JXV2_9GLOM|nr:15118_t:CDS:2 [Dentiscutata heterogama]